MIAQLEEQLATTIKLNEENMAAAEAKFQEENNALNQQNQTLEEKLSIETTQRTNLEKAINRYREAGLVNMDLVKDVQSQLSDAAHSAGLFSFPRSVPIPGSLCIDEAIHARIDSDGSAIGENLAIRSRLIVLDNVTAKLNQYPDLYSRINILIEELRKCGGLDKFAERIIRNGGATMFLVYNSNCTNYELYLESIIKKQSTYLVIDDETVKKIGEG